MSLTVYQFPLERDVSVVIQMLAFSLEIRKHLIAHRRISVTIPKRIYEEVPHHIFEELIFDNLSQVVVNLHEYLDIKVKPTNSFSLELA